MRLLQSVYTSARPRDREAADLGCRQAVEILIDQITEQSFPASDPPAWGTVSSRFEQAVHSVHGDNECSNTRTRATQ
jgi:hypothetical protein